MGNADYTIDEPIPLSVCLQFERGPAVQSTSSSSRAKPEFHKKTFSEAIHAQRGVFVPPAIKVSLPGELTKYKDFLRGTESLRHLFC